MNRGKEVPCCFVIAGCYPTKLLEPGEKVLNQMARRVHVSIECSRLLAIGFRRDHRSLSGGGEWLDNPLIGIERLIGEQHVCPHVRQKFIRANQVMGLSAGQMETNRIAEGINQGVDFRAQSTARPADRLVNAGFFWAPALCWWARTMVLSIIAYSLSASAANC